MHACGQPSRVRTREPLPIFCTAFASATHAAATVHATTKEPLISPEARVLPSLVQKPVASYSLFVKYVLVASNEVKIF